MVKKRIIFYVGGYDPQPSEKFFRHLTKQINIFQNVWGVEVETSPTKNCSEHISLCQFTAKQPTWQTKTDFYFLASDDVVGGDYSQPFLVRLWQYIYASFNYFFSGTVLRFAKISWRYHAYFLYPFLAMLCTFLVCIFFAFYVNESLFFALPIFLILFWLMKRLWWDITYIMKAMQTWVFSLAYIYQQRPDVDERLQTLANKMKEVLQNESFDEMLLIGHSLGGAFLIDAAHKALPEIKNAKQKKIILLTLGSTILKVALHRRAKWLCEKTSELFSTPNLSWLEYQNHLDLISFYKVDPAKKMGLQLANDSHNNPRPLIKTIRFGKMLNSSSYKRMRHKLFRIHYQFIYASQKKYHYDFPCICLGPQDLLNKANNPHLYENSLTAEKLKGQDE